VGKINCLVLKISLGIFAVINFISLIITTDLWVIVGSNLFAAFICLCIFLLIEAKLKKLSVDLKMTKDRTRTLVGDYFVYYKNIESISIDEYLEMLSCPQKNRADN
jgi:hypothetical protein